jgi:hypothetical protein
MRRVAIMNGGTRRIGEAISVALCDMEYCVGVEVDGPPASCPGDRQSQELSIES